MPKGKQGFQYEPKKAFKKISGLFFKMKKPGASEDDSIVEFIVFESGKVNLGNAKSIDEAFACYKYFFEEILIKENFLKEDNSNYKMRQEKINASE